MLPLGRFYLKILKFVRNRFSVLMILTLTTGIGVLSADASGTNLFIGALVGCIFPIALFYFVGYTIAFALNLHVTTIEWVKLHNANPKSDVTFWKIFRSNFK